MTISFRYSIMSRIPCTSLLLLELIPEARDTKKPWSNTLSDNWPVRWSPPGAVKSRALLKLFRVNRTCPVTSIISTSVMFLPLLGLTECLFSWSPMRSDRVRWALTFPPSLFLSGIPLHISSDYWMNSIENILNLFVLACFWTFCQIYRNL